MSAFASPAAPVTQSRFTFSASVPVIGSDGSQDGHVGEATDTKGTPVLAYRIGRAVQSVEMHAVSTALTSGKVIPLKDIVTGFHNAGTLGDLRKAIDNYLADLEKAAQPAARTRSRKASTPSA